jgi:hypothetical protein
MGISSEQPSQRSRVTKTQLVTKVRTAVDVGVCAAVSTGSSIEPITTRGLSARSGPDWRTTNGSGAQRSTHTHVRPKEEMVPRDYRGKTTTPGAVNVHERQHVDRSKRSAPITPGVVVRPARPAVDGPRMKFAPIGLVNVCRLARRVLKLHGEACPLQACPRTATGGQENLEPTDGAYRCHKQT